MKNFKIPKNVLHLILLIIIPLFSVQIVSSQNISEKIFGQNAWMPYSIGSTVYNGKMDSQWKKVKDSHAKITRYGGIAVDKNMPTNAQYLNIIDSIRSNGMEPVMLVSFYNNTYTASQSAQTVEFINITNNKNVKYWVIGNEPDNEYGFVNAAQVADYIKKFSLAMKEKDNSIKILAPETAWYNQNIIDGLTTPGGISDITGKDSLGNFIIDMISFHIFPFRGTQRRTDVLTYLAGPDHFEDDLTQLNLKIAACNSFHQRNLNSQLKIAVTEANVNWNNPQGDGIFGLGANSFIGGQFWAEMIGICMKKNVDFINFWSVIEGNELGYLYQASTLPKPSYYHFQMLADNFKGAYCNGIDNNTNVKSFGSKNGDQISVIIMNQDQSNDFIYKLRLDTNLISGTDPLKINIDAGTNVEYSDTTFRESSVVLIFNSSGTLINKCVYKLYGNADQNIPPTCNTKAILPVTTKTSASFAVIGDFGLAGNNELEVANLVKSWNPDFIITTGDNNYELGQTSTIDANVGQYYHDYIYPYSGNYGAGADSIRFFPSLGNHDLDTDNGAPYLQYFTLPGNERYYDYIKGNIHFFVLNSDLREVSGVDSSSIQALWLKDKLQNSTSKWNVVYYHHPPYCSERDHGSQVYMQWPFKRWGADIVLSGHSHVYERLIVNSFPYIVNGLGGRSIHPFDPAPLAETIFRYNSNYGAMLCNEYSDTLSFRFYNKLGTLIDSYYLSKPTFSVIISLPLNNSIFSFGTPIIINANVTGGNGGIRSVDFFANNLKLGTDSIFPFSYSWVNAPAGSYSLTVTAIDSNNNSVVSEIINISVATPLTTTINSPSNNSSFNVDSTITIQATAAGGIGPIQKIEFFADTIKIGEDITSPYSLIWSNAISGNYSLSVKATDSINNTSVSEIVNITIYPTNQLTATINLPLNDSFFNEGTIITLQAAVSGGVGPIQKVEFFADTIKIGEDFINPYSFAWNNASVGNHSLTVKATDSINNTAVSAIIYITVVKPLTTTITAPANNTSFNEGSPITIQAVTSDGTGIIQKVEFFADSIKLGEDLTSPYNFSWNNALAGNYALTARATDSGNNTAVSEIINITVIIPLTATIISPANNSFFNIDSTINILVTTEGGTGPIQKVDFFAGTTKLGEDTIAPYGFVWNNATAGNYALTAKVTDSVNNTSVSHIINITVTNPLTTTITAPANNTSFNEGSPITIQAVTSDGTGIIQKVEFFADSIKLGEDLTSPYNFLWNNALAGNYALTARATDSGNNTAVSEIINITVIIPLTATIISPPNNSDFYADSTITIVATTSGGTGPIQKVEFFSGTIKLGEDTIAPYNFIWNNITVGAYALTAMVTDSVNNNSVSEIINITVNPTVVNCIATGTIAREVWSNVSGSSVSAIPLSLNPSLTGQLTIFEAPKNFANNYGQRISGYICPPITGNYIFWIASDNDSELWLSTDNTPANKQKIASVSGYTSSKQWTKYASQKSVSKNLIAGRNYYIEALHKESNQGDNCAVGWQLPSGVLERPIPGNRLSPFELIPSIQLISAGSSWKYLDNGTNQGTAWRATNFSDAAWKTGNAELGYGDGGEATVVSYGPSSTNKFITTYFRKTFNVSDISFISGLELSLIRDDGAVVYINGVEVYRSNLPTGTIYYNTLAPSIIDKTMESTYVIANIGSGTLVNGTNHIAVEIHQNAVTSPDMSFNLKLKTLSGSRIMDNEITNDSTEKNTILENTVEMIVYPNPTTGQFNLELCIDDLQEKNVVIEVTNSLGQVIYKKLPQKINGCIKETIDLESSLPSGIYIMHVTIDDKIQIAKMLLTR